MAEAGSPVEFSFEFTGPTITLSLGEIWPDGDAPANPTAEDVAAVMRKVGPKARVFADWGFMGDVNLEVSGARGPAVQVW